MFPALTTESKPGRPTRNATLKLLRTNSRQFTSEKSRRNTRKKSMVMLYVARTAPRHIPVSLYLISFLSSNTHPHFIAVVSPRRASTLTPPSQHLPHSPWNIAYELPRLAQVDNNHVLPQSVRDAVRRWINREGGSFARCRAWRMDDVRFVFLQRGRRLDAN